MTDKQIQVLADRWLAIYESAENDQWALAEIAYNAVEVEGDKPAEFAKAVGKPADTIRKYRSAWTLREADTIGRNPADLTFGDFYELGQMSPEMRAVTLAVAEANDTGMSSARKSHKKEVAVMRDYLNDNPDMVQEVLADASTRTAVNQAAFRAATADMGGKTSTPAGGLSKKEPKPMSHRERNLLRDMDKAVLEFGYLERHLKTVGNRILADIESAATKGTWDDQNREAKVLETLDWMRKTIVEMEAKAKAITTSLLVNG